MWLSKMKPAVRASAGNASLRPGVSFKSNRSRTEFSHCWWVRRLKRPEGAGRTSLGSTFTSRGSREEPDTSEIEPLQAERVTLSPSANRDAADAADPERRAW